MGNSDEIRTGDRVYAIGAPAGLEVTLSEGIVSGVRDTEDGYKVVQTTAPASAGSSGGGIFDSRGQLIGISTFKIRGGENLNFAMPVNYVRGLLGVASAAMSLSEVNARYGKPDTNPNLPSPSTTASGAPTLAASYRSLRSGSRLLVWQRGATLTIAIQNEFGELLGNAADAAVTWNADGKVFRGIAEVRHVCGSVVDKRVIPITSEIEFYFEHGGVLRERYSRPIKINCSRGRVGGHEWVEDRWWP